MDLMARDVLRLLDDLAIKQTIWVGHSMGGYVTMAAWRLSPERFSGLGLVASNHRADAPEAKQRRYDTAQKVAEQGAEAAVNAKLFAADTPEDAPYVVATHLLQRSTLPAGIIGTLQAMAARRDSTETLKTVNVPALVVGGEGDQLFPPEIPQTMAQLLETATPSVKLIMLPTGHMPMLEQPDAVNDALADLVEQVTTYDG
jgi:pimeloyl-ACP methyl ester carboxylesterase